MTNRNLWLEAFPIQEVDKAVELVLESWSELASRKLKKFSDTEKEPDLTKTLRLYIKDYKAIDSGLFGQWGAEQTEGELNLETLETNKCHRTDIHYAWHDSSSRYEIIFEFKKLSHRKNSRDHYYGEDGMRRFIDGKYAKRHPLSFMVGILMSPKAACIDPLKRALSNNGTSGALNMLKNSQGQVITEPSLLFKDKAMFDTEHVRPEEMAPKHGTITISHLFVEFPFQSTVTKNIRARLQKNLD